MLESMRKHMNWIMWIIVGLVTISFLFFGIFPTTSGGRVVAKVDGDVITVDEWNRVYQNITENYRQILKDQFNERMSKTLRTQALRELITNKLLIHEAERIGLKVTDAELQESIMKYPAFSRQGKFDQRTYERSLDSVNLTPASFEANQREFLLRQKLEQLVKDGIEVSDAELLTIYNIRNPKAKPKDFEKNKVDFRQTVLKDKRSSALDGYVRGLYKKAKVKMSEKTAQGLPD